MRRALRFGLCAGLVLGLAVAGFMATAGQRAAQGPYLENFHLLSPMGRAYSIEKFPADSVLVIYFGYTTCLRACPTALNSIAEAIDRLGPQSASVRPIFIDMDPERAALVSMPLFMQSFGPSFLGLTGSPDEIERAARAFKVRSRAHPAQWRSDRLRDETHVADFRDET